MQRRIQVTLPSEETDDLLGPLRQIDGVLTLQVERGVSLHPEGDLVSVEALTEAHLEVLALLEERGLGRSPSSSVSVTQTSAVISPTVKHALGPESMAASWEHAQAVIAKTSNATPSGLLLMAAAGAIAAVGIVTGALHIAVGAFIIAPGFEPIIRIPLGLVARTEGARRGLLGTLKGYAALVAGAVAPALTMRTTTDALLEGGSAYFAVEPLVSYWTSIGVGSALVALVGGAVGTVMVLTDRAVLTAGVMIALALVPTATVAGIALAAGDFGLMGQALLRWLAEVVLVLVSSATVLAVYRARVQPRPSML